MPLKNFQYDALMRNYNQKQFLHKHEQDERIQKAEAEIPQTFRNPPEDRLSWTAKSPFHVRRF